MTLTREFKVAVWQWGTLFTSIRTLIALTLLILRGQSVQKQFLCVHVCVCARTLWITVIWVWWVITCSCYIIINELFRAGKAWNAEAFFAYNKGQERCHLMHENTHAKSKSSVWICRADKVVIIAISVSALIVLITLNWLLLSWSIITCDLSVTRLWEFSGVSVACREQCSLSLLFEKSLQRFL